MDKNRIITNYKISLDTYALLPAFHIDYQTKAITRDGIVPISPPPLTIIKENCLRYGSSYDGRRESVLYHLNFKQRTPIPIHPSKGIFAFPTMSVKQADCKWIFFHAINNITSNEGRTIIELINGEAIILDESYHTILKQYDRSGMVRALFGEMG